MKETYGNSPNRAYLASVLRTFVQICPIGQTSDTPETLGASDHKLGYLPAFYLLLVISGKPIENNLKGGPMKRHQLATLILLAAAFSTLAFVLCALSRQTSAAIHLASPTILVASRSHSSTQTRIHPVILSDSSITFTSSFTIDLPLVMSNFTLPVLLDIPPREYEQPDFCGEVCVQETLLYYGREFSQVEINQAGGEMESPDSGLAV
jgi:hypothetical protein